jgi:dolichol-phosphate mannosyltransferase
LNITIVLPTYNEAENLPILFEAIFSNNIPNLGLLIVDDNSPDGTGKVAEELAKKYPGKVSVRHRKEKAGLGSAYLYGFGEAIKSGADVIGQMDSDLSHPPEKLPAMIEKLQDYDIAIGSRYIPGGSVDKNWPIWRKGLSRCGNFYAKTILSLPLKDTTGGFRLWKKAALEKMPLDRIRSNGYIFLVEMAYVANMIGLKFGEVPIYFADRQFGDSKMNLRIQLEAAYRVWQVKFAYRDLRK